MRGSRKAGWISAAILAGILGGCSSIENGYDDLFGISRTVPDGASVDFSNRHAPILNSTIPGANGQTEGSGRDIYSPETAQRRIPVENNVPGDMPAVGEPPSAMAVPVPNAPVAAYQPAPTPTITSNTAPVMPVTAAQVVAGANAVPPSEGGAMPVNAPMASAPVPVAMGTDPNLNTAPPVVTTTTNSSYPALSSVPPAPATTPRAESMAEMKEMNGERTQSDTQRQALMNDPNATVMTSPQTGQMVDNAADATAPQIITPATPTVAPAPVAAAAPAPMAAATPHAKDDSFNTWLHGLFSDNNSNGNNNGARSGTAMARQAPNQNPAAAAPMATNTASVSEPPPYPVPGAEPSPAASNDPNMEPVHLHAPTSASDDPYANPPAAMPVAAPAPVMAPAPVADMTPPAPAPMEPVHLTPPTMTSDAAPAPQVIPAPPPVTPDASAAAMEPVHLHPPGSVAATDQSFSGSTGDSAQAANETPVTLTPPSSASQGRYLPDSRYAARRAQATADSDNN